MDIVKTCVFCGSKVTSGAYHFCEGSHKYIRGGYGGPMWEEDKLTSGRNFDTGAYRDTADGKLDYARALSPEVLERYLEFLLTTRKQSNGEMREFDNWKEGIPVDVYMSSMFRHVTSVWKYVFGRFAKQPSESLEDALCAVIFNSMGMLHEVLKGEDNARD